MSDEQTDDVTCVWEYIIGYAPKGQPHKVTFFDYHDNTLYREISLDIIGQHGWEMISVITSRDPSTRQERYEYFFKRDRNKGYPAGFSRHTIN